MARSNNFQVRVSSDTSQFDAGMRRAQQELRGFSDAAKAAFSVVGITSFAVALRGAIQTIADFERANSELAAVLGTNLKGVEALTNSAKQLGRTSEFTASEVTQLQIALSRLGFDSSQIEDMQKAVLDFALAMNTDLASAAEFTGAALRAFGLEAEDTSHLLDVMSAATTNSALDFSKLQASLSTVAPIAKSFGLSVEETAAFLGVLANNGFDASSAATALRNILLNLADSNGKLAKGIGHSAKSFDEIIAAFQELNDKGVDVNDVLQMTDKRSAAAAVTIIKQAGAVADLKTELDGAEGSLSTMADTMHDNLSGALKNLSSAWEGFILALEGSKGPLKYVVDRLTDIVNRMTDLVEGKANLTFWEEILGPIAGGLIANGRQKRKESNSPEPYVMPGGSGGGGRPNPVVEEESPETPDPKAYEKWLAAQKKAYQEMQQAARAAAQEAGEVAAADAELAAQADDMYEHWRAVNGMTTQVFDNDLLMAYAENLKEVVDYEKELAELNELLASTQDVLNERISKSIDNAEELATIFSEELVKSIESGLVSAFDALADAIGGVTEGGFENVAKALIEPLADMAIRVGTLIMLSGTAIEALKDSLIGFFGGSAILAGGALIAVGVAAKAGLASLANGSYSASANVASSNYSMASGDYETRDVQVHVSGQLKADGDQLVAVIENTNTRNGYTT